MSDDKPPQASVPRRWLLATLSGAGTMGFAGCNGKNPNADLDRNQTDSTTETPTNDSAQSSNSTPTEPDEPADIVVESLSLSTTATGQFQPITAAASLTNDGGSSFVGTVAAIVDTELRAEQPVLLSADEQTTIEMTISDGIVSDHELILRVQQEDDSSPMAEQTRQFEIVRRPQEFVDVDGTRFTCGDGSLYLTGSNDQQVVATQIPESRIEQVFTIAEGLGMNVMRVFGFGVPWSEQAAQPEPGEYNETFFKRFDRIVASAKRHDLRLIVPLVNNNRQVDSISRYVSWVDGATDHNDFYEMEECRQLYRDYVEYVLTRENSLTGLEYREDPTIMMWELGNELNAQWPKKYPLDWIREVGSHIKSLDSNHLLASDVRGLQWGSDPNDKQSWRDEITEQTTMVKSNRPEVIDVVSIHYYPDPNSYDIADPTETLQDIVQAGHELVGKPVYLGEFNWGVRLAEGESIETRNDQLSGLYDVLRAEQCGGAIIHEISTAKISNLKSGSRGTFNIVPEEDSKTAQLLRDHSEWARSLSVSSCVGGNTR